MNFFNYFKHVSQLFSKLYRPITIGRDESTNICLAESKHDRVFWRRWTANLIIIDYGFCHSQKFLTHIQDFAWKTQCRASVNLNMVSIGHNCMSGIPPCLTRVIKCVAITICHIIFYLQPIITYQIIKYQRECDTAWQQVNQPNCAFFSH